MGKSHTTRYGAAPEGSIFVGRRPMATLPKPFATGRPTEPRVDPGTIRRRAVVRGALFVAPTADPRSSRSRAIGSCPLCSPTSSPWRILGGLLLAIGLATPAAAVQIPILTGEVFLVHWRDGPLNRATLSLPPVLAMLVSYTSRRGFPPPDAVLGRQLLHLPAAGSRRADVRRRRPTTTSATTSLIRVR